MKLFRFYWDCGRQGNVLGTSSRPALTPLDTYPR